jgi:hypothetical protein
MAETFEDLYDELSKKPDFVQYFGAKEDFEGYLSNNANADSTLENLYGVKSASEYLKKKDQPIIQDLAEESSSFQSPSVGQTEELVAEAKPSLSENLGDVAPPSDGQVAITLGNAPSAAVPSTEGPKPSSLIKSTGREPFGGPLSTQYQNLYREIFALTEQPAINIPVVAQKVKNFVEVYKQLQKNPDVDEDLNTMVKQLNKKYDVDVNDAGLVVKPKTQKKEFPALAPKQPGAPFKQQSITERLAEADKPKLISEQQDAIESYVRGKQNYDDLNIASSTETEMMVEQGMGQSEKRLDQTLLPDANRLLKSFGSNMPANFFDNPATIDGELNPNRKLSYDFGVLMLDDANNPKINPVYVENKVDEYLNSTFGPVNDETAKRLNMSKEEIAQMLKPRLLRMVKAKAEETLIQSIVEKKLSEVDIFAEDVKRADINAENDIKSLVANTEKVKNNFDRELASQFEQTLSSLKSTSENKTKSAYDSYLRIVQSNPNLSQDQRDQAYKSYVDLVSQENTTLEETVDLLKKEGQKKASEFFIQLENESKKDLEAIQEKYGIAKDVNEKNQLTTAAYRKYRDAYQKAYGDYSVEEIKNSNSIGWRLGDILSGRAANTFGNAINSLSAAVGYEDNPLTGLLKHLELVENSNQVYIRPFDQILKTEGLLSVESLKSVVQNVTMQGVNMALPIATTVLTGNPYIGGAIGFAQDTWDQTGENYKNAFNRTGSIFEAENAAAESLRTQILISPTYALEMLPFTKGFLSGKLTKGYGIGGVARKIGVSTALEEAQEVTQEIPQSYLNYKYSTDNPTDFSSWVSENGLSTAINILPTVAVLSGSSSIMESVREKQMDQSKNRVLAKLKDAGLSQMVTDAIQVLGEKGVSVLPEYLYAKGMIDINELKDMKKSFSEVIKTFPAAKELISNRDHQKYYVSLAVKKARLQELANKETNENTKILIDAQIKGIDTKLTAVATSKNLDYTKITFNDNFSIVVDNNDLLTSMTDGNFVNAVIDDKIKIESQDAGINNAIKQAKDRATQEDTALVAQGPQIVTTAQTAATSLGATIKDEEKLNQIADKARAAGQQNADKLISDAQRLQGVLDEVTPGVNIIMMNQEEFSQSMNQMGTAENKAGNISLKYDEKTGKFQAEIQINMDAATNTTIGHEVSHLLLLNTLGSDPKLFEQMKNDLLSVTQKAIGEKGLASINALVSGYRNSQKGEEFVVELAPILAEEGKTLKLNSIEKIARVFSDFIARNTNGKIQLFESIKTREGFIDYMNALSETLATGKVSEKLKLKTNAVQEQSTNEVPVQPEAIVGEEVVEGKPKTESQVTPQESQEDVASPAQVDEFLNKSQKIRSEAASGTTQRPNTVGSYVKAATLLKDMTGDVLDYGAGLGLGTDAIANTLGRNIDSYEPNPQRWQGKQQPTFTGSDQINKKYDGVVLLNVVNAVPKDIRDAIVLDVFDKLNDGGKAVISSRKWKNDIEPTKGGKKGPESKSYEISNGAYQKGFDGNELVEYLQDILGPKALVSKDNSFGPSGAVVSKISDSDFINKSQLKKPILVDENGNARDIHRLGWTEEESIPLGGNKETFGRVGEAAINQLAKLFKDNSWDFFGESNDFDTEGKDEDLLREFAKENNVYLNKLENIFPPMYEIAAGEESRVWLSKTSKYTYKATLPLNGINYLSLMRRIMTYNTIFPETAYEILGFSDDVRQGKEAPIGLARLLNPEPTLRIILKQRMFHGIVGIEQTNLADQEKLRDALQERITWPAKISKKRILKNDMEVTAENFEGGILIDDLHNGNVFFTPKGQIIFLDPFITLLDAENPNSYTQTTLKPIFEGFINKGQLNYSNIALDFSQAMQQSRNNKVSSFTALINKGYTPKRIKEVLGTSLFDENAFKQAQANIAVETMNKVNTAFSDRQVEITRQISIDPSAIDSIYENLIAQDFSPLEIFKAVTDMDFLSNEDLIDIFGADYRKTVQNALDRDKEYPSDFLNELEEDAKNLKVEQKAADVANVLRETGLGLVDSAVTMDMFLQYLKEQGFDQIAIALTQGVKRFGQDKDLIDKGLDWADQVRSGKIGDNLYTPESIVYAFQVSSELFSQAGRILQMARFFNQIGTQKAIEKTLENNGVILTPKQKETLTALVNDYKNSQKLNSNFLSALETDWSDQAFDNYWKSEKAVGDATIRVAQFLEARKPIFWNERITSGGSRALLNVSTAVLSYVANVENNIWSTNFATRSIQKLRDQFGKGIKGNTLSFENWRMARNLSKARYSYVQSNNFKYGVLNTNKGLDRYYDNLGQVNFFKDPQWAFKFMDVWVNKSTGKSLSDMTMEEQADALDLTLTKLKNGTIELRDGKEYTMARSLAWSFGLGPIGAIAGGNPSMLLASFGPAAAEFTGRVMAYGGDISFGQMAAQRSMIDYFQNIQGTRFQDGVFDGMFKKADGNLDEDVIRAMSAILYNNGEMYAAFEREGLKRTLLGDNIISGAISAGRGAIRKKVRDLYSTNRAQTPGTGLGSEIKRQFTVGGVSKNLLQVGDVALWTLMPFTKVPVNFLGTAIAKTVPAIASPKYLISEGIYQYKFKQFNKDYKIGKKLNNEKQRKDYELAKIDLFAAKRQATYDAAQMITSWAIYGFAMSAVKAGAILIGGDMEKDKSLKNIQLRGGLYNATLHAEYMKANGMTLLNNVGKTFGQDWGKQMGTNNFITRRGGFAKEGDKILNTNNAGFLGYAMNLYGSVYEQGRAKRENGMGQLLDDQKNGLGFLIQSTLSNGIENLPMFQGLARVGALTNDLKNPDTSAKAWENFASGTLSTSMSVFFPSFFSFMSKGNAEIVQSASEISKPREDNSWPAAWGPVVIKTVQRLNRNISFNEDTRNEFYKAAIGPFGEDLQYKVTLADPGTAGAYFQAVFDPFALRRYSLSPKDADKEKLTYVDAMKVNSGLMDLAMMYQQMTGRDYEWKWNGKTSGMYQVISNPMKNKFRWEMDITTGADDKPNSPNYFEYELPNDLYREELKIRGEVMRTSLRKYGEDIARLKPVLASYIEQDNDEKAQEEIVNLFNRFEQDQLEAIKTHLRYYRNDSERKYLRDMQKRGLITEQMQQKLIAVGLANSQGLIP